MIWTSVFFFGAVAAISALELTQLLPSETPTTTRDPWECLTEDIPQYFKVPMPTGNLIDAIFSYGGDLLKTCTEQLRTKCKRADKTQWCDFTTAAPSSLLTEYFSYGKEASSWWSSHSSNAVSVARRCPNNWYNAGNQHPAYMSWLNLTITFAECHAEARVTASLPTTQSALPTPGGTTSMQATNTAAVNGVRGRSKSMENWLIAGTGIMAYAAANELW